MPKITFCLLSNVCGSYKSWLPLVFFQNVCCTFLNCFVEAEMLIHLMQLLGFFLTLWVFRPEMQQKLEKDHECHLEMFYHYKILFINQNAFMYSLTFSTLFFGSVKTIKIHLYKHQPVGINGNGTVLML